MLIIISLLINPCTVPAPLEVTIHQSRDAPLFEGTIFSLTCTVIPNRTGVDTNFQIQLDLSGTGTSATNRVTVSDTALPSINYQTTTVTFNPLALNDTGLYECSVTVISVSFPYVTDSDTVVKNTTISVSSQSYITL